MEKQKVIICLHGFLGLPNDWDFLDSSRFQIIKLDYMNIPQLSPENNLDLWCENFNKYLLNNFANRELILVGYSLGGRLILNFLHWLNINHSKNLNYQIEKSILISTGLSHLTTEERLLRKSSDQNWANLFLNQPWPIVINKWNAQPVFKSGSQLEPIRLEKNYNRNILAQALINWSPSKQIDLSVGLEELPFKITWIVGSEDHKYVGQLEFVKIKRAQNKDDHFEIIQNCGHRVFFEDRKSILRSLKL